MLAACTVCLAFYFILVRSLRYRRLKSITSKFTADELREMTPYVAQQIVHASFFYDTPLIMLLGTQVALFKVYGISTIASVLLKSGELTSAEKIDKRLADTSILIATALSNPLVGPGSGCPIISSHIDPRGAIAIARINYLHGKYPIKNDDFLYNLALFMIEPIRWTARFDWRPHSPLEIQAIFVLWTEVGRRMGIQDIWTSYDEMVDWATQYEIDNMVPSEASQQLAQITIEHLFERMPKIPLLHTAVYQTALALLDKRTRKAMGLRDPSPRAAAIVPRVFLLRAFFVRHFCLPRWNPSLWVSLDSSHKVDEAGVPRMSTVFKRQGGPWYYPETIGLGYLMQRVLIAFGLQSRDQLPGKQWRSQGYRLEEMGPVRFENAGHEQVMHEASVLQGCPITGLWGRPPSS
ncbi:hypothetical protein GALMADRAFT_255871 [Galerina marginata CBS 339.88]|uniref:ER-bound oxygenase mpaB/mpaB'/Rubber oxygenase catalytic domain-containing protein n=1 Tax=Galerina marginata (strain CBS 339.88) TaxID=685588 RepID=A0A067SNU7_GALM3|nr:hypothetical protein GALMADRAFT_255871 [Galerina marginata CBS 339.88]